MYTYHRATEHSPESYIFAKYYCCVIPHQGITAQEAVSPRSDVDVTTSHRPQRVSDRLVHVHLACIPPSYVSRRVGIYVLGPFQVCGAQSDVARGFEEGGSRDGRQVAACGGCLSALPPAAPARMLPEMLVRTRNEHVSHGIHIQLPSERLSESDRAIYER